MSAVPPVPVVAQPEISDELVELVAEAEYDYDYEADPIPEGLVIPWSEAISLVRNSYVRRARAGLEVALPLLRKQLLRDPAHQCTYTAVYFDAQKALDELLGPDEEDGCDGGLVADIWHLARRCEHFEQATTPEPRWGAGPLVEHNPETHAGYPGSGLARCGAPIGAHTVAPGEKFTCRKCQAEHNPETPGTGSAEPDGGPR